MNENNESKLPRAILASMVILLIGTASKVHAVEVDDTAKNKSVQTGDQLNAEHQGSSTSDVTLTQKIRQDVMKMKDASTYAKNVKIITVNGHVTLKGPVNSDSERSQIEQIAKNAAGGGSVTNQLDVKK